MVRCLALVLALLMLLSGCVVIDSETHVAAAPVSGEVNSSAAAAQ